ncbi:MAG: LytTR family DNA-binding domain-containing protein [Xanthomonadales bacterium]|nr:LytTR family DNA-binding domain-containing protein [Xanthomonadales bacterium]
MQPSTLQHYLDHRRRYEILLWVGFFMIQWIANVWVIVFDIERVDLDVRVWEIIVWEGSSGLMFGLLIPLLLAFDRAFPLRLDRWRRGVLAHLLFTVPFSVAHVVGMVAIRKLVYAAVGGSYDFGPWPVELFYEYLKDFRTYLLLLALIYLYRFILLRLQGEAQFLAEGREEAPPEPVVDRFLVKKLGREFLVKVNDIDWIEAAGNYVNLHVGQRLYPLRETMTNIEARLTDAGFVRVHRSAIVNMDRIAEISPFDTGDAEARLETGAVVPISRRYRSQLREQLA